MSTINSLGTLGSHSVHPCLTSLGKKKLCSQSSRLRRLVLINLISRNIIPWWIHISPKSIYHQVEFVFKILSECMGSNNVCSSLASLEKKMLWSQSSRLRELLMIKLVSRSSIQWWIHLYPKYIYRHMETVVKFLHLQLKVWVLLASVTCHLLQENNLFAYT